MDQSSTIVTFSQLNKAFNEGNLGAGRLLKEAEATAQQSIDDPVEAAMLMASMGQALKVLEDNEKVPGVLSATDHKFASLLQTFLAREATDFDQLPAGGFEAKFDEKDLLGWFGALFSWVKGLRKHPWVITTEPPTTFDNTARLGILGDWGTGLYGAPVCAESISNDPLGYELLLHLGDVYYSGDKAEVRDRFLKNWPKNSTTLKHAINRACNSNHEMYTGANAYFGQTLPAFQQSASFFALQNDYWLLIGIDSAYFTPDIMHNVATLDSGQIDWMTQTITSAGDRKVILFSHHQPFSHFDGGNPELVGQLDQILKKKTVFAWYWGHEHRCVLFDKHPVWNFYGRCSGHSGFPYFRDKISQFGTPISTKGANRWFSLPEKNLVPGARVLDGPNPYVRGHENRYGVQGYFSLAFNDAQLVETVHSPDGTILNTLQLA